MAARFDCFSLTDMVAKPEDTIRLCSLTMADGQRVRGYRGDYFRMPMGDAMTVVRMMPDMETGDEQLLGIDTHVRGKCVWDCWVVRDLTPEGADEMSRRLLVGVEGCDHVAAVDILCAQVLPRIEVGDSLRLNMAAFPYRVAYSEGACNPVVDSQESGVLLEGVVKDAKVGETYLGMEPLTKFVSVTVTTSMGDVELCHSYDMVAEEQKDLVKVGSVVSAYCTLSGDVAVGEYAAGIVYGEEQDLKLLQDVFSHGGASRVGAIMHSDAACTFLANRQEGIDMAMSLLTVVCEDLADAGITNAAFGRITGVEQTGENPPTYIPGKRCLLLGDKKGNFAFICYLQTDSLGRIKELVITNDSRYDVEPDK